MRIIIAGSRIFDNYDFLRRKCCSIIGDLYDWLLDNDLNSNIEIISGQAKGTDKLVERFAKEFDFKIKLFPANWEAYGKSAGYKRNVEMSSYAKKDNGVLIAFWDGKSPGTKHMIDIANKDQLKVFMVHFQNEVTNR